MKKENKKVSVIIPTYNRIKTLKRAVDSVLNQTYSNVEVIIVDDCSKDNTEEIVKTWKDPRIQYYKLEKNSGACVARNKGVEIATGEYIAFQDSDDEWFRDKLEKQITKLEETQTLVNFCAFYFVDVNKNNKIKIPNENISNCTNLTKKLLYKNFISTQTILGKKQVFEDIKFDEKLPRFQDWDLAIRLSKKYEISYTNEILVNLYVQADSMTVNNQKGYDGLKILYNKYRKDIEEDIEIKYEFKTQMAKFLFNTGSRCTKELKESLKLKFNTKMFLYYISCLTRTNKMLLKIKNSKKGIKCIK